MNNRKLGRTLLAAVIFCTAPVLAADVTLFAVHGIDGRDLGLRKALPVDVSVDGACALPNFRFGQITDGITLPAGSYDIAISLRDRQNPCEGTTVIAGSFRFHANGTYSLVAHLDADGAPTASKFKLNDKEVRESFGRLTVIHTAVAPAVDITVSRPSQEDRGTAFERINNGGARTVTLADGSWLARIYPSLALKSVAGPAEAPIQDGKVTVVYAVGSLANGTFGLLAQIVDTAS